MPRPSVLTFAPERLRELCVEKGWTTERLAVTADLTPASVRAYMDGRVRPSPASLVALATALDVSTAQIAPYSEAPTLHELRWHVGMTVDQLAKDVQAPRAGLYGILRGADRLPADTAIRSRLAATLRVDDVGLQKAWQAARDKITAD
ncbi:helix-turn-helix domain-containing protein [Aeromicrobium sp. CF4.19]|uniref:helix-turn-helix domain-containing protein n=1 Tax=Aeromicrobium sp. CF4.19 TaxID=3373082 RepID=UPI003EE740FC